MADVLLMTSARAARYEAVQEQERRLARNRKPLPAIFTAGQWSVAAGNTIATVTVSAMPTGAEAIMYNLNGGKWQNAGKPGTVGEKMWQWYQDFKNTIMRKG